MKILGIIPARLASERFPNKLLTKLAGTTIIERVIKNAQSFNVDKIVLATDSVELCEIIKQKNINIETFFMKDDVWCGSQRSFFVSRKYPDYDFYMSIPADEPLIDSSEINKIIPKIRDEDIYTLYSDFQDEFHLKRNQSCKIVSDKDDYVLYFSRSVIPILKSGSLCDLSKYKKHIGVFFFSRKIIDKNIWNKTELASQESLEQNAFIENGYKVKLLKINHKYYGVDQEFQIKELEEKMR